MTIKSMTLPITASTIRVTATPTMNPSQDILLIQIQHCHVDGVVSIEHADTGWIKQCVKL